MKEQLELEHDRITCNPRIPSLLATLVYTGIYLGLMLEGVKELLRAIREGRGPLPMLILLLIFTAIWLFLVRNFNSRIVFDAGARKVYKRTLLGYRELMDFADIGGIVPVEESHQWCSASTYYKIARRGDRYGRGIRLTANFGKNDQPMFERNELPSLLKLLEAAGVASPAETGAAGKGGEPVGALPETPVFFRKDGSVYHRSYRFRIAVLLCACLAMVPFGLSGGKNAALAAGSAICLLFAFLARCGISLDAAQRTITVHTGFGLRKKVYSFDDFDSLSSTRETVNFIPTGTYLYVNLANRKTPVLLGVGYLSAKWLDGLSEEFLAIISAVRKDETPPVE